jgi:type I restriction enzyme S subunit
VPEGWEKVHLSEIVSTQYGYTESATEDKVGPKFLRGTDINKTSYIDWSSVPYCPIEEEKFKKYELFEGDILAIRMADPGKVALIEEKVSAVFASYLVRLKIMDKKKYPPLFIFYQLMDNKYQGFISGASTGSTRKSASAKLLTDFDLIIPNDTLPKKFANYVQPIRNQIKHLVHQNEQLSKARDLQLPKLMNGEIAV